MHRFLEGILIKKKKKETFFLLPFDDSGVIYAPYFSKQFMFSSINSVYMSNIILVLLPGVFYAVSINKSDEKKQDRKQSIRKLHHENRMIFDPGIIVLCISGLRMASIDSD